MEGHKQRKSKSISKNNGTSPLKVKTDSQRLGDNMDASPLNVDGGTLNSNALSPKVGQRLDRYGNIIISRV